MSTGDVLTYATIHGSMVLYALGALGILAGRHPKTARVAWTLGCLLLWVHVPLAIHFTHHWDNAHLLAEIEARTYATTGVRSSAGVYLNYLTMLAWAADTIWWWTINVRQYRARRPSIAILLHAFLFFMTFNATVVFGHGLTRWLGGIAALLIAIAAIPRLSKNASLTASAPS